MIRIVKREFIELHKQKFRNKAMNKNMRNMQNSNFA
jgi:hypothetical protein